MANKISKEKLKQKLDNNNENFHLVEVLKPDSYSKMHIKGAINIPLESIGREAKEKFSTDDEIVVYCSDKDCTASPKAADKLEELGYKNVYHYQGGKKEWSEAGLPTESGQN